MASYQSPGIAVHQVLTETNSTYTPDQNVLIIGGHALLTTYAASGSRKNEAFFGNYTNGLNNEYSWKRNSASGVADEAYTRIFLENALLRYAADTGTVPANSLNEVTFNKILATNSNYYADPAFGERGVRVGDVVRLVYTPPNGSLEEPLDFWTRVTSLKSTITDNTVTNSPAIADSANLVTRNESVSYVTNNPELSQGITPQISIQNYVAPSAGLFSEKYTLTAVRGTTNGRMNTAEFTLLSESGLDDHQSVTIEEWETGSNWTSNVTFNGLTIGFTQDNISDNILTGASWTITVNEAYTAPALVVNGNYKGNVDTAYIVTVKKGGTLSQSPVLVITTTLGNDTVKEVKLTAANTPVPLGNKGLTLTLTNGTKLRQGDRFVYTALASQNGPVKTLILAENIPTSAAARTINVEFHTVQTLELSRYDNNGQENWSTTQQGFSIAANILLTDPTWALDETLPLTRADVYATTRLWQRNISTVLSVSSLSELDNYLSGDLVPDNELKYGVYKALQNSEERVIMFTAVDDPSDLQTWTNALIRLERNKNVYDIVPLTFDIAVQNLVMAHVASMSTSKAAKERMGWFCRPVPKALPLYVYDATLQQSQSFCTVLDNPNTLNTQYNYLIATSQPNFLAKDVQFGDVVRTDFYIDNEGKELYTEYVIDAVVNNTTLILQTPLDRAINLPQRFEVWRPITLYNYSEAVGKVNVFDSRRCVTTWPDYVYADGYTVPGYFATAAAAAIACSTLPQRSITQRVINGLTEIPNFETYSDDNLNELTTHGITVLAQTEDGDVIVRHAVTTGNFDNLNEREEMSTRNFDSVTKYFRAGLSGLINQVNNIDSGLLIIANRLRRTGDMLKLLNYTEGLGGHIVDYEIVQLELDPNFEDACIARIILTLARCLNRIDLYLQI
jgi:hypothetical protein